MSEKFFDGSTGEAPQSDYEHDSKVKDKILSILRKELPLLLEQSRNPVEMMRDITEYLELEALGLENSRMEQALQRSDPFDNPEIAASWDQYAESYYNSGPRHLFEVSGFKDSSCW